MTEAGELPRWAQQGRLGWRYNGQKRPAFATAPKAGQESVWDYPRPPLVQVDEREVIIALGQQVIVHSHAALRVLETASPPTFYLPCADIDMALLQPASGESRCEWKGEAQYWDVVTSTRRLERVAWSYPNPFADFGSIADHIAFYPSPLRCTVNGELVLRQPGQFYGGWVTSELVGPFKGESGSSGW